MTIDTEQSGPSKRLLQLAQDVREFIANMFAKGEIRDPRVQGLTILHVKLTADLRIAKVYYITPAHAERKEVEKVLKNLSGYIRRALGKQLLIRHIPEVHFYYDDNVDHSIKMNDLLTQIEKDEYEKIKFEKAIKKKTIKASPGKTKPVKTKSVKTKSVKDDSK